MSFTYHASLPTRKDHARLALNDLDSANAFFDDETIEAKLASFGYLEGVAQLADSLAVRAAQDPDKYAEGSAGLTSEWSERVSAWRRLADDLRGGRVAVPPGGISRPGVSVSTLSSPDVSRYRGE